MAKYHEECYLRHFSFDKWDDVHCGWAKAGRQVLGVWVRLAATTWRCFHRCHWREDNNMVLFQFRVHGSTLMDTSFRISWICNVRERREEIMKTSGPGRKSFHLVMDEKRVDVECCERIARFSLNFLAFHAVPCNEFSFNSFGSHSCWYVELSIKLINEFLEFFLRSGGRRNDAEVERG